MNDDALKTFWARVRKDEDTRIRLQAAGVQTDEGSRDILIDTGVEIAPGNENLGTLPHAPSRASLKALSTPELRQAYVSIVGRSTKSTNRDYLLWKIGQVQKGKLKPGPRGQPLPERGPGTLENHLEAAISPVLRLANGRVAATPVPDFLKDHTFSIKTMPYPDDFVPLSHTYNAAWHLELSLHETMRQVDPSIRALVRLYLKQFSEVLNDVIDVSETLPLGFIIKHWKLGDVGCAERLRRFLSKPMVFSLTASDPEATMIRLGVRFGGRRLGTTNTILVDVNPETGLEDLDELFQLRRNQAQGLASTMSSSPSWFMDEPLRRGRSTFLPDPWTQPDTGARLVEHSIIGLERRERHVDVVRLYLREMSRTQEKFQVPASVSETVQFLYANWELGDIGAGRKYATEVAQQYSGGAKPEPSRPQRGRATTKLDARLNLLESRLQRRR